MSKASDAGKAFLSSVLAKLPEEKRAQAEALFADAASEPALEVVGSGALGQAEISRRLTEIREKEETLTTDYERLNGWYQEKQALLDKYPSLGAVDAAIAAAKGTPPPSDPNRPTPSPSPSAPFASKEDLDKYLAERDKQRDLSFAGAMSRALTIASRHQATFNEALDADALIAHAFQKGVSLDDAYKTLHGEKLDARAKALEDARINKLADERLAEKLKERGADQPFPLRNASPSVLDVLNKPDFKASDFSVDAAVAEYNRLQEARGV